MSHLNSFNTGKFLVTAQDDCDKQAARQLGYNLRETRISGRLITVIFEHSSKTEAQKVQQKVNDRANSLRLPPGSPPEAGKAIRDERHARHLVHQKGLEDAMARKRQKRSRW